MNKRNVVYSLLILSLLICHGINYAESPFNEQTILPLESAVEQILPAIAVPVIVSQSYTIPGLVGFLLFKLIFEYYMPSGPLTPTTPGRSGESVINPDRQIQLGKYIITNHTDKPITYDARSGKFLEAKNP